ncbi:MAG: hypothetical protein HYX84_08460 [Chloroflexi bacterium]|nr:hypothetical protein [Chloroflexota bacterium]
MRRMIIALLMVLVLLSAIAGCAEPTPPPSGPAPYLTPTPAPVTGILPAEHPRDFPENLRELTDEEKQKAINIALATPEAQEQLKQSSNYTATIGWIALFPNKEGEGYSGYKKFDYGIVKEGIPRGEVDVTPPGSPERVVSIGVPEDAGIYPVVDIGWREPLWWNMSVAIDLKTEKVVFIENYPNHLGRPDRFPPEMLEVSAVPSRAEYTPGQPVELDFTLRNVYSEPVILSSPPEVWVLRHDLPGNMNDWIIRSYAPGSGEIAIGQGETSTYKFTWDQKDDAGNQVAPGYYYVLFAERPESQSGKESRRSWGEVEVLIQYEQGAMKKTIDLNLSQTVSGLPSPLEGVAASTGLTLTLKRVELSEKGAKFYAVATLPGYQPAGPLDYTNWISCADAEYSFSGITKDAGCAHEGQAAEGIRLWWGYVNPVDQVAGDARELVFKVYMNLDGHPRQELFGPWEFRIPLE